MNLEQAEKDKILLEERYRQEIRINIARNDSKNRAAKFLNSAFGLWLLSAIFLSGAGTIYQNLQKKADEQKASFQKNLDKSTENLEIISKLDIEISYRLSGALLELSAVEDRIKVQRAAKSKEEKDLETARATFAILLNLNSKERAIIDSLYPDFDTYNLVTLFAELRRRLPETERAKVEKSLAAFSSLTRNMHFDSNSPAPNQAAADLFRKVMLPRWTETAFHHIDCSAQNPFC